MTWNRKGWGNCKVGNRCFFIGHRDAPEELQPRLAEAVERHITQYGVTEFVVGHYGCFDRMAATAVREAKDRHPKTTLILLLPYYPFEGYKALLSGYDATVYPPGMESVPKRVAIVRANAYMIQHSEYLICYCLGYVGNTREIVAQAMARKSRGQMCVENLAD